MSSNLKLAWCSHEAATYAVTRWHYSHAMPVGKLVKIGVWESGVFKGVVLFARGSNNNIMKPYGLKQTEGCELVRVALTEHVTPVSRIIAIAIKMLRKFSPGTKLIVSYADPEHGHHGGIYQAGGWLYVGRGASNREFYYKGRRVHYRTISSALNGRPSTEQNLKKIGVTGSVKSSRKFKYLMPLDEATRAKVVPLRLPYPKRAVSETKTRSVSD